MPNTNKELNLFFDNDVEGDWLTILQSSFTSKYIIEKHKNLRNEFVMPAYLFILIIKTLKPLPLMKFPHNFCLRFSSNYLFTQFYYNPTN